MVSRSPPVWAAMPGEAGETTIAEHRGAAVAARMMIRTAQERSHHGERVRRRPDPATQSQRSACEKELVCALTGAYVGKRVKVEELSERDAEEREDASVHRVVGA
jgi:hypothetical protein